MIAPLRQPGESSSSMTTARRAIAAALLNQRTARHRPAPQVSKLASWTFAAWVAGVAIAYYAASRWWKIPPY